MGAGGPEPLRFSDKRGRNPARSSEDERVKLVLDLQDIKNRGDDIDRALQEIIHGAVAKKAPLVGIIPGKGWWP